jgi:hypothetical protein
LADTSEITTIRLELGNFGFDAGNRKGMTFAGLSLVWLLVADGRFAEARTAHTPGIYGVCRRTGSVRIL